MMEGSRWEGKSAFPSSQIWADEVEKVLNFAVCYDQFESYLGLLAGTASQRDSALAELRVAFYFRRNGFKIAAWRPIGEGGREGEFSLRGPSNTDVFTEVKGPGWEFELSKEEIEKGRQREPKDIYCEARHVAPSRAIRFAIDKAYGKFTPSAPSLLCIVDDLFISLANGTQQFANEALYDDRGGYFTTDKYRNLGAVGIFWVVTSDSQVCYEMKLFLNPYATTCGLPDDISKGFHGYLPLRKEAKQILVVSR